MASRQSKSGKAAKNRTYKQQSSAPRASQSELTAALLLTLSQGGKQRISATDKDALNNTTDDLDTSWGVDADVGTGRRGADAESEAGIVCIACKTSNLLSNRYCSHCGIEMSEAHRLANAPVVNLPDAEDREKLGMEVWLISINEDGSDGMEIPLRFKETIVGRSGDTRFPTDAFLSPVHTKLLVEDGCLYIIDMHSLNGTYVRIRGEVLLADGDCFLMGRQVLRFEKIEQHIAPKARADDGTRFMGSPPPNGKYRVLQIGIGGTYQNVYTVPEQGVVLGREKGDITFNPDRFMSGRHARLYLKDDGNYYLADLNSSNGTWTRIFGQYQLHDGDLIFLGQQLFRVKAPDLFE